MNIYVDIRKSQKQNRFGAYIRLHGKRIESFISSQKNKKDKKNKLCALIRYYFTNRSSPHHPALRRSEDILYKINNKGINFCDHFLQFILPLGEINQNTECDLHIKRITIKKHSNTSTKILETSFNSCHSLSFSSMPSQEINQLKTHQFKNTPKPNFVQKGAVKSQKRDTKIQEKFQESLKIYNTICQDHTQIGDQSIHHITSNILEAFLNYFQSTIQCLADFEDTDTHLKQIFNINGKYPQLPRGEVYGN